MGPTNYKFRRITHVLIYVPNGKKDFTHINWLELCLVISTDNVYLNLSKLTVLLN